MARAVGVIVERPILCLPPATGELPEEGGVIVSSAASPTRKPIEHAGHSYQQQLIRIYGVNCDVQSHEQSSEQSSEQAEGVPKEEPQMRAQSHEAAKSLASKMAVGSDDLYELLELGDKRWHATADDIKKSFRRISLIYHPDKISHHGDEAKENAEAHFKAVMKAYDILSDKKKRAAYDSIDDVDDSIPTEKDATSSPARFYEKFGACFAINARWSVSDRVPELGDDHTDLDNVHRFYDFWYSFKSWRDFSFDLEYDTDQAECREEKRWMERQNAKHVKTKKLEENARIRRLVDLAYKHDPRLLRAKQAEKAKKDAEKEKRRRKAEEETRRAKEKEEEERLQAERKAAEEKAKRAAAKKQKDAARQIVRKARQKLRAVSRELGLMESERGLVAVERMCGEGNASSIEALFTTLSALPKDAKNSIDRACSILDKALTAPEQPITSSDIESISTTNTAHPVGREGEGVGSKVPERLPNGKDQAPIERDERASTQKTADAPWTPEELSLLSKGLAKFPGGTRDRWQRLADYISSRTADEVLRKVNETRASKLKSGTRKQNTDETDSSAFVRFQEKKKGKPVVPQRNSAKANVKSASSPPSQPPNKLSFTPKQQALFEDALKKYPKGEEGRWKKVSAAVGRTPQHCQQRFDELIAFYAAKRAAQ